jgi:two-component system, OmpR family, response regulator
MDVTMDTRAERGSRRKPIRVLLLDDDVNNLILRAAILRKHGYESITSSSVEEAETHIEECDIAVLDYHLGAGKFGTEVASTLRRQRPQVPIIILSATLERKFGGIEDMHLLKGYSSAEDLISALKNFEAKRRGKPVVVDARDFYYSRISKCMGEDVALEILDRDGNWQYVNDYFAALLEKPRTWFVGKNLFDEVPELPPEWRDVVRNVSDTRETFIDRTMRGLPSMPKQDSRHSWNVLAFPLRLHDNRDGVVLSARIIRR